MFKVDGKRGNYPALICRASVHDLSGKEYRINGVKTTDWHHPVYEPVGEVSGNHSESVGKLSGNREVREEKKEERTNQDHPEKKRDDTALRTPREQAKRKLMKDRPPKEGAFVEEGLRIIDHRVIDQGIQPNSPSYYLTAFRNLEASEKERQLAEWYVQNPASSDNRQRMNALILTAEEESKRTGRSFDDCFHELRQDPRWPEGLGGAAS